MSCEALVEGRERESSGMWEHRPIYKQGQRSKGVLPGGILYLRSQKWENLLVAGAGIEGLRR